MGILETLTSLLPKIEKKTAIQQMGDDVVKLSNEELTKNYLSKKFQNPALVAGIMGNIEVETGGTFNHTQKEKGGSGTGLFQFTYKPMKQAYGKFVESNKLIDSSESQIDFIHSIMNSADYYDIGAGNRKKLQQAINSNDPAIIAQAFSDFVERPGIPHNERRIKSAIKYYNKVNK